VISRSREVEIDLVIDRFFNLLIDLSIDRQIDRSLDGSPNHELKSSQDSRAPPIYLT